MRKHKIAEKAIKSIAKKKSTKKIATKHKVPIVNTQKINHSVEIFKTHQKIITEFLEGKRRSLPTDVREAAKIYFLFKLKNEQHPVRHKPSKDPAVKNNFLLYTSFIEKLS